MSTGYCSIHGVAMSWMESKTKFDDQGLPKKYQAHRTDQGLCFGAKTKPADQPPQQVSTYNGNPSFSREKVARNDQPDWDEIARGKVRHGFAIEAFKMQLDLNEETIQVIDNWVSYVMEGKLNQ